MLYQSNVVSLGVTSCFPGEGKSTLAINLARATASAGYRVLLVDGGTRGDLSRQLLSSPVAGLAEVLHGKASVDEVRWTDPATGMHFLASQGSAGLGCFYLKDSAAVIARISSGYDLVVFDLPAVASAAHEVRAAAVRLDALLLVVEYQRAHLDDFARCLSYASAALDRLCGVVLNKVDRSGLKHDATPGEPHAISATA
jgi:Mrp family chromosome partitioning ATPase